MPTLTIRTKWNLVNTWNILLNIKTNLSLLRTNNSSIRIAFNAPTSSTTLPNENKNWQNVCLPKWRVGYSHFTSIRCCYEIHTVPLVHIVRHTSRFIPSRSFQTKFKIVHELNNQLYTADTHTHMHTYIHTCTRSVHCKQCWSVGNYFSLTTYKFPCFTVLAQSTCVRYEHVISWQSGGKIFSTVILITCQVTRLCNDPCWTRK